MPGLLESSKTTIEHPDHKLELWCIPLDVLARSCLALHVVVQAAKVDHVKGVESDHFLRKGLATEDSERENQIDGPVKLKAKKY